MTSMSRDHIINQALSALQSGQPGQAAPLCRDLVNSNPRDAEAWSFLGLTLLNSQPIEALQALRRATELEPTEPRWHLHLGHGHTQLKNPNAAEAALHKGATLSNGAVEAVLPWADALMACNRPLEAARVYERIAEVSPTPVLWHKIANAFSAGGDSLASVHALEKAYQGQKIPAAEQLTIARFHITLNNYEQAQTYIDHLLTEHPADCDIALTAADLARWRGQLSQASEIIAHARQKNPENPFLLCAQLDAAEKPADLSSSTLAQAEKLFNNHTTPPDQRRTLGYALAKIADTAAEYQQAWDYLTKANNLYTDNIKFDLTAYEFQLQNALTIAQQHPATHTTNLEQTPGMIYIIGPPRSGGSLLQTILAADNSRKSLGERGALMPWFLSITEHDLASAQSLWKSQYKDLSVADFAGLQAQQTQPIDCYIDKTPHYAHMVGLLSALHPQAQFIDARRDPRDIALSIYMHDFPAAFSSSRKLIDIADYLLFQRRAIEAWRNIGIKIHTHDHDAFIHAPETKGEALFQQLGLDWQNKYLESKKRNSIVRTFSAQQVRQGISTSGSGRWKNYATFLDPILDKLTPLTSPSQ